MAKKVLFTASICKHIIRFHLPYLEWFKQHGYETHVACSGEEYIPFVDKKWEVTFARSPFSFSNVIAFIVLRRIVNSEIYTLIHCHTPTASVITRLASVRAKRNSTKILYTAHGFHFCKGGPLHYWLLYYPVEIFLSSYCDAIITINQEDYDSINKRTKKETKIFKIPGIGLNQNKVYPISNEEKPILRRKYGFSSVDLLLVYAAEFIKRKNHVFIIDCLKILKDNIPNIKILFPGRGIMQASLQKKVNNVGLDSFVYFLGFREDIDEIYKIADIGVSSSRLEGLGLNVIEMMMTGLPVVASDIRGHRDIIQHMKQGFLFNINNKSEFINAIIRLSKDEELVNNLSIAAVKKSKEFELSEAIQSMSRIYKQYL